MGSYALTGRRVHRRPVYRHVEHPWTVLFDGERWNIRYRLDPKAPPVAFANSRAHAADAIAPVGGTWHVRSGRNYTLEAHVTTHCNPVCRVIEIAAHSPTSEGHRESPPPPPPQQQQQPQSPPQQPPQEQLTG